MKGADHAVRTYWYRLRRPGGVRPAADLAVIRPGAGGYSRAAASDRRSIGERGPGLLRERGVDPAGPRAGQAERRRGESRRGGERPGEALRADGGRGGQKE